MSLRTQTSVPADDDLDGLLRAFYQAQLPDPWPPFRVPASRPAVPPRSQRPLWRSRLALAAAIALLVLGSLSLAGRFHNPPAGNELPSLGPGTADTRSLPPTLRSGALPANRVKSSLSLEQPKDGPTVIKVEVLPASR